MTRSMTISSSHHNKPSQTLAKTPPATMQLPDIIPSAPIPTLLIPTIATVPAPVSTSIDVSYHLDEHISKKNRPTLILGSDNIH